MYALNINNETNRILSATFSKYATNDAIIVDTLPDDNITDYLYINGKYVYEPAQAEEFEPAPTELEQLKERIDALYKAGKLTEEEYNLIINKK